MKHHILVAAAAMGMFITGACRNQDLTETGTDFENASDGPGHPGVVDDVGESAEPVRDGPCLTACTQLLAGDCDWQSQCSEEGGPYFTVCNERAIDCLVAEKSVLAYGDNDTKFALSLCWRSCMKFKN